MNGFLYVLEGQQGALADDIDRAGLSDAFPLTNQGEPRFASRGLDCGPENVSGCIVAAPDTDRLGYYPAEQEWRKIGGRWIGWRRSATSLSATSSRPSGSQPSGKSALPGPQELSRDTLVPGMLVTLGDNRQWLIPTGRTADGGTNLPTDFRLVDATGEFGEVVKPEFKDLRDLAERLHRLLTDEKQKVRLKTAGTGAEFCRMACKILAVNYRVRPVEISVLGLLTADATAAILAAFIGLPPSITNSERPEEAVSGSSQGGRVPA